MSFIIMIIICLVLGLMLFFIFDIDPKKPQQIVKNEKLNDLAKKYPSNIEICKDILKMLENKNVKIEEDKDAKDCLYMVAFNKIIIAGTQANFTRIQTIAHECVHSIQSKKLQMFNFVFSNVCILYYILTLILAVLKVLPDKMLFLGIYILLCFIQFIVRAYLENDAMIKAKYVAKEYMELNGACSKEEIEQLVDGFEQINSVGIKGTNFSLVCGMLVKIIFLSMVFVFI